MKCSNFNCEKEAVTFHGVMRITHGYCESHRCCAVCGLPVDGECDCASGPTERKEYIEFVKKMKSANQK